MQENEEGSHRAYPHAHSHSAAAMHLRKPQASWNCRSGGGGAVWICWAAGPLASTEQFGSCLVQLVPRHCGEGSQLDSLQPKNLLFPGPLEAPLPPTDAGGGRGLAELRAEETAAEHRRADSAWVKGELLLLGAAHNWQRGRASGHQCGRESCQTA